MPSSKPTDEILAALPEVGLKLCNMGERPGHPDAAWVAQITERDKPSSEAETWAGHGTTPAACLTMALQAAGVKVTDE